MRKTAWLALGLALAGCAHRAPSTSDRILDDCLAEGRTESQCKRSVGCAERLSIDECRKSFRNRHKFYINYD